MAETTVLKSASSGTLAGAAALSPIHSRTVCRLMPSDPPGWCRPKSSRVKPRRSISTMARASPIARDIRVEVVGARPLGQASATLGMVRQTSEWRPRKLCGLWVRPITGMSLRAQKISGSRSSRLSPELDRARSVVSGRSMPRSPWLISAGWTKKELVPVEARVAAILPPMCPDLPMPVTTT